MTVPRKRPHVTKHHLAVGLKKKWGNLFGGKLELVLPCDPRAQWQHLRTSPCSDATQPQRYEQGLDGTLEPQKRKLTAMSLMAPDGLFKSPNSEYFFQP